MAVATKSPFAVDPTQISISPGYQPPSSSDQSADDNQWPIGAINAGLDKVNYPQPTGITAQDVNAAYAQKMPKSGFEFAMRGGYKNTFDKVLSGAQALRQRQVWMQGMRQQLQKNIAGAQEYMKQVATSRGKEILDLIPDPTVYYDQKEGYWKGVEWYKAANDKVKEFDALKSSEKTKGAQAENQVLRTIIGAEHNQATEKMGQANLDIARTRENRERSQFITTQEQKDQDQADKLIKDLEDQRKRAGDAVTSAERMLGKAKSDQQLDMQTSGATTATKLPEEADLDSKRKAAADMQATYEAAVVANRDKSDAANSAYATLQKTWDDQAEKIYADVSKGMEAYSPERAKGAAKDFMGAARGVAPITPDVENQIRTKVQAATRNTTRAKIPEKEQYIMDKVRSKFAGTGTVPPSPTIGQQPISTTGTDTGETTGNLSDVQYRQDAIKMLQDGGYDTSEANIQKVITKLMNQNQPQGQ